MTKNLQKMAVAAAAAILGLGATTVKSAEAASVNLTFFDEAHTPVGVGSFSYDESTRYEGRFFPPISASSVEIKPSDKWFVVKDLAVVNLLGLSWGPETRTPRPTDLPRLLWAPSDNSDIPGSLWGRWLFGDIPGPRNPTSPFLEITGSRGPTSRWRQDSFLDSNGNFGPRGGEVIAEENSETVPEPATTAGLALAAAGLGYAKKKFGASKV
jgi:hypothetical protein